MSHVFDFWLLLCFFISVFSKRVIFCDFLSHCIRTGGSAIWDIYFYPHAPLEESCWGIFHVMKDLVSLAAGYDCMSLCLLILLLHFHILHMAIGLVDLESSFGNVRLAWTILSISKGHSLIPGLPYKHLHSSTVYWTGNSFLLKRLVKMADYATARFSRLHIWLWQPGRNYFYWKGRWAWADRTDQDMTSPWLRFPDLSVPLGIIAEALIQGQSLQAPLTYQMKQLS